MVKADISRIEPLMIRPNDLALLVFPEGLIPIRAIASEFFQYLYDPVAEGQLAEEVDASASTDGARDIGFVAPDYLRSRIIASQPIDVLRVDQPSTLYQVFIGIAPSYVRVFISQPPASAQKNIDVTKWSRAYAAAGYIDGFASPLLNPAPESELIVTYQLPVAIGYGNVLHERVRPLLQFYINKVKFGVVGDVDLVMEMLDKRGRGERAHMKVVGGLSAFAYDYVGAFRIRPIPIGATRDEVARRLRGG